MRPLTPSETAVLDYLRTGFGDRVVRAEVVDDPERGLWVGYELAGSELPTHIAVDYLARMVDAGRPVEAVVGPILSGPPPAARFSIVRILQFVTLAQHRQRVALGVATGVVSGAFLGWIARGWLTP